MKAMFPLASLLLVMGDLGSSDPTAFTVLPDSSGDYAPAYQAAGDYSISHNGVGVRLVWSNDPAFKYPVLKTPVVWKPLDGTTQATMRLTVEGPWFGAGYSPPDPVKGGIAFTALGLKGGYLRGLHVSVNGDHGCGLWIGGSSVYNSSGQMEVGDFGATLNRTRSVGLMVGGDRSEGRGDDYAGYELRNVTVTGQAVGDTVEARLRDVVGRRNVGILWQGQNTQTSEVHNLNGSFLMVAGDHYGQNPDWPGLDGGKSVVYSNLTTSYCGTAIRMDGDFSGVVVGGRIEDGIVAAMHGWPFGMGTATGSLVMEGTVVDGMSPYLAPILGLQDSPVTVKFSDRGQSSALGVSIREYVGPVPKIDPILSSTASASTRTR